MKNNSLLRGCARTARNGHRLALRAPDEACAVLDDESQAEREQQAVERIAPVNAPDERALDEQTDDGGQQRRNQQRAPEADVGCDRVRDVAADDEEAAMSEVDDIAEIENQRQPERHQHVKRTDDQSVRDVEEEKLGHRRLTSGARRGVAGRAGLRAPPLFRRRVLVKG